MKYSIGIDLGTTNTVVSTSRRGINSNVEVSTETIDQIGEDGFSLESSTLLPSVLFVNEGIHNVGLMAKAMKGQNFNRVIVNSKNYIGESNYKWEIDKKAYTPELVASYFLSAVRKHLVQKYNGEESINSAVITVPASFNIDQRNSTKMAAKLAGFKDDVILISEPTAAILDFINEQSKLQDSDKFLDFTDFRNVLVFDLGGGTCDVAILRIKINGKQIYVEEVAVSPHTLVGGTNFDAYAVEGIISDFQKENKIDFSKELSKGQVMELKGKLLVKLEQAKIYFAGKFFQLNDGDRKAEEIERLVSIPIQIPNVINDRPFKFTLTMERYNQYIEPLLTLESNENIIRPIELTLKSSNFTKNKIDHVFCVGGMTKYPAILNRITKYFSKEPLKFTDSMVSVSRGASIYHHYEIIEGSQVGKEVNKSIDIIPTLPQTVYLNVKNGFPIELIEAKTKAGTPIVCEDLIEVNSEVGVSLELYAGMSIFDTNLKRLENVRLDFPFGIKIGTKISLRLEYTQKGILMFQASVKDKPEIEIKLTLEGSQLREEEIECINKEYGIETVRGIM